MTRERGLAVAALALGAGGGVLLWHYLRARKASAPAAPGTSSASVQPAAPLATADPAASPVPRPTTPASARTLGACQLRLDTSGLSSEGAPIDVAGAVARCKAAGKADLVYANDAPASVFLDLNKALADAGVSVVVWAP
ncbi:MAG: hypothetical protein H6697_09355 [Myxococcales bacterium]|nr:hypothetical protein [Myxococcales bacterium]